MTTKKCTHCGSEVNAGLSACPHCKEWLEVEVDRSKFPPLNRQNYMIGKLASVSVYAMPALMGLLILFGLNMELKRITLYSIGSVILAIWLLVPAFMIYSLGKYLENFTENKNYRIPFAISIGSLVIFYICLLLPVVGITNWVADKVVFQIFVFYILIPVISFIVGLNQFNKNRTKDDFVGGLDELLDSVFVQQYNHHKVSGGRSLPFIFTPHYMNQMFGFAKEYAKMHGYKENNRK